MRGAAGACWAYAAATRCWAKACRTRTAWRGQPGEVDGLGLLDIATVLTGEKTLREVEGACLRMARRSEAMRCMSARREAPTARGRSCASPTGGSTAQCRRSGQIAGAYVHGLFADDRQRAAWLAALGTTAGVNYEAAIERTLDALAEHCEAHLDCDALLAAARRPAQETGREPGDKPMQMNTPKR